MKDLIVFWAIISTFSKNSNNWETWLYIKTDFFLITKVNNPKNCPGAVSNNHPTLIHTTNQKALSDEGPYTYLDWNCWKHIYQCWVVIKMRNRHLAVNKAVLGVHKQWCSKNQKNQFWYITMALQNNNKSNKHLHFITANSCTSSFMKTANSWRVFKFFD